MACGRLELAGQLGAEAVAEEGCVGGGQNHFGLGNAAGRAVEHGVAQPEMILPSTYASIFRYGLRAELTGKF